MRKNLSLALLMVAMATSLPAFAQNGDVAVVISPANSVTNLTSVELRKLFAGERHFWPSGQPVKLFARAPGTRERLALLKLLGMTESEYKQYWTTQVFRGQAQDEPLVLPSNGMQKEAVANFSGALVLVAMQDVKPGMKVVKVNGYLPGVPGYPLH